MKKLSLLLDKIKINHTEKNFNRFIPRIRRRGQNKNRWHWVVSVRAASLSWSHKFGKITTNNKYFSRSLFINHGPSAKRLSWRHFLDDFFHSTSLRTFPMATVLPEMEVKIKYLAAGSSLRKEYFIRLYVGIKRGSLGSLREAWDKSRVLRRAHCDI